MSRFRRSRREEYPGSLYGLNHTFNTRGDYDRPWRERIRSRYDLDHHGYFDGDFDSPYRSRWEAEDEDRWSPRYEGYNRYENDYPRDQRRNYADTRSRSYDHDRWDESGYGWNRLKSDYNYDHQFDRDRDREYDRDRNYDRDYERDSDYSRDDWENNYSRSDFRRDADDDWKNRFRDDRDDDLPSRRFSAQSRRNNADEDSFENISNYGRRHSSLENRSRGNRVWRDTRNRSYYDND